VTPSRSDLDRLAALLNGDDRITIFCGAGCQGAHDELMALGECLKAPMVHAMRGKEHVEWDNPYDVGMTGLIGFSSGYYAMRACDVLLMLGTDFPYRQFYPEGNDVRIAQVDLRPENIGRRVGARRPRQRHARQAADPSGSKAAKLPIGVCRNNWHGAIHSDSPATHFCLSPSVGRAPSQRGQAGALCPLL